MELFKVDGCLSTETALAPTTVVLRFNPGRDGLSELGPVGPAAGIEHVRLHERKERFHRGVVTTRADATHRTPKLVVRQHSYVHIRPELTGVN